MVQQPQQTAATPAAAAATEAAAIAAVAAATKVIFTQIARNMGGLCKREVSDMGLNSNNLVNTKFYNIS